MKEGDKVRMTRQDRRMEGRREKREDRKGHKKGKIFGREGRMKGSRT